MDLTDSNICTEKERGQLTLSNKNKSVLCAVGVVKTSDSTDSVEMDINHEDKRIDGQEVDQCRSSANCKENPSDKSSINTKVPSKDDSNSSGSSWSPEKTGGVSSEGGRTQRMGSLSGDAFDGRLGDEDLNKGDNDDDDDDGNKVSTCGMDDVDDDDDDEEEEEEGDGKNQIRKKGPDKDDDNFNDADVDKKGYKDFGVERSVGDVGELTMVRSDIVVEKDLCDRMMASGNGVCSTVDSGDVINGYGGLTAPGGGLGISLDIESCDRRVKGHVVSRDNQSNGDSSSTSFQRTSSSSLLSPTTSSLSSTSTSSSSTSSSPQSTTSAAALAASTLSPSSISSSSSSSSSSSLLPVPPGSQSPKSSTTQPPPSPPPNPVPTPPPSIPRHPNPSPPPTPTHTSTHPQLSQPTTDCRSSTTTPPTTTTTKAPESPRSLKPSTPYFSSETVQGTIETPKNQGTVDLTRKAAGATTQITHSRSLPIHCIIEQASTSCPEDSTMSEEHPVDTYAIVPGSTLFSDIVVASLARLGYSEWESLGATGGIQLKNWRTLPFSVITPRTGSCTVEEMLGEITSVATLRIRICCKSTETLSTKVKDKLLQLLLTQSKDVLVDKGCPVDKNVLDAISKGRLDQTIPDQVCEAFTDWLATHQQPKIPTLTGESSPSGIARRLAGDLSTKQRKQEDDESSMDKNESSSSSIKNQNLNITSSAINSSSNAFSKSKEPHPEPKREGDFLSTGSISSPSNLSALSSDFPFQSSLFRSTSSLSSKQKSAAEEKHKISDSNSQQNPTCFNSQSNGETSRIKLELSSPDNQHHDHVTNKFWNPQPEHLHHQNLHQHQQHLPHHQSGGKRHLHPHKHPHKQQLQHPHPKPHNERPSFIHTTDRLLPESVYSPSSPPQPPSSSSSSVQDTSIALNFSTSQNNAANNSQNPGNPPSTPSSTSYMGIMPGKTRIRTSFDPEHEIPRLQKWFGDNQHPTREQMMKFMHELNRLESRKGRRPLDLTNIIYWFKNARAAQRRATKAADDSFESEEPGNHNNKSFTSGNTNNNGGAHNNPNNNTNINNSVNKYSCNNNSNNNNNNTHNMNDCSNDGPPTVSEPPFLPNKNAVYMIPFHPYPHLAAMSGVGVAAAAAFGSETPNGMVDLGLGVGGGRGGGGACEEQPYDLSMPSKLLSSSRTSPTSSVSPLDQRPNSNKSPSAHRDGENKRHSNNQSQLTSGSNNSRHSPSGDIDDDDEDVDDGDNCEDDNDDDDERGEPPSKKRMMNPSPYSNLPFSSLNPDSPYHHHHHHHHHPCPPRFPALLDVVSRMRQEIPCNLTSDDVISGKRHKNNLSRTSDNNNDGFDNGGVDNDAYHRGRSSSPQGRIPGYNDNDNDSSRSRRTSGFHEEERHPKTSRKSSHNTHRNDRNGNNDNNNDNNNDDNNNNDDDLDTDSGKNESRRRGGNPNISTSSLSDWSMSAYRRENGCSTSTPSPGLHIALDNSGDGNNAHDGSTNNNNEDDDDDENGRRHRTSSDNDLHLDRDFLSTGSKSTSGSLTSSYHVNRRGSDDLELGQIKKGEINNRNNKNVNKNNDLGLNNNDKDRDNIRDDDDDDNDDDDNDSNDSFDSDTADLELKLRMKQNAAVVADYMNSSVSRLTAANMAALSLAQMGQSLHLPQLPPSLAAMAAYYPMDPRFYSQGAIVPPPTSSIHHPHQLSSSSPASPPPSSSNALHSSSSSLLHPHQGQVTPPTSHYHHHHPPDPCSSSSPSSNRGGPIPSSSPSASSTSSSLHHSLSSTDLSAHQRQRHPHHHQQNLPDHLQEERQRQPPHHDSSSSAVRAHHGNSSNPNSEPRKRRTRVFIDPLSEIPKLEKWFVEDTHPSAFMIDKFCEELNQCEYRQKFPKLEPKNVQLWFKNHRAKVKRLTTSFNGKSEMDGDDDVSMDEDGGKEIGRKTMGGGGGGGSDRVDVKQEVTG